MRMKSIITTLVVLTLLMSNGATIRADNSTYDANYLLTEMQKKVKPAPKMGDVDYDKYYANIAFDFEAGYETGYRNGVIEHNSEQLKKYEQSKDNPYGDGGKQVFINGTAYGYINGYYGKLYDPDRAKAIFNASTATTAVKTDVQQISNQQNNITSEISQPRYLRTEENGMYVARLNKMYQIQEDGSELLLLDLGIGSEATNLKTGMKIKDFSSFVITDISSEFFGEKMTGWEYVLVCGIMLVPDPNDATMGIPVDVIVLYYPEFGETIVPSAF